MDKNEKTSKRPGASLSRIGLWLQDFTAQKMLKCYDRTKGIWTSIMIFGLDPITLLLVSNKKKMQKTMSKFYEAENNVKNVWNP